MWSMFNGATSFNQPLGNWDVSSVANMNNMFASAVAFNQPIGDWDVSSVTTMWSMFNGATSFDQPLENWDVSSVTNMTNMFYRASSFNQPIGDWDVSSVTTMWSMFNSASAFNQPIGDWNVSSVTNMNNMFASAVAFDQPLENWDVSSVTQVSGMFSGASSFNQPIGDWNVSSVTNMWSMFNGATSFDQPLENWDVSSVTNMTNMFYRASSFNQPIGGWDVSSVTTMWSMFNSASAFNQPIGDWDVSSVTNMNKMFLSAVAFDQPLENWDVSSVNQMYGIFDETHSLSSDNKGIIHQSFSTNSKWPYDWSEFVRPISNLRPMLDLTILENQPIGTIVGEFKASHANDLAINYHLVAGEGDGNNSLFTLDQNGTLKTAAILDYEAGDTLSIRVQARDEYNAMVEENFTVSVFDVYEPSRDNYLIDLNSSVKLEMIWVEPGTFMMGQAGVAEPVHQVTLTKGFYLGKYEVTQAQYEAVMTGNSDGLGATPSNWPNNPNRPVEMVSWEDIQVFLTV